MDETLKNTALLEEALERLRSVLGPSDGFIPLHVPEFLGEERALVANCIDTGWVSSVGAYVDQFERDVAAACGTAYGVAVVNGTAALELGMKLAGVQAGDEVIMPALTFVATANAAHHLGAIPHFVDSALDTLGLDPVALGAHLRRISQARPDGLYNRETGRRISCVVPMHVFGHPADLDGLTGVASEFGLTIVEDAAESLGSRYKGRACGSFGRVAAVSFNGNKIVTTGGGGAIVTDDEALARRAKHLSTTAKIAHPWAFVHDEPGYNYRLPNLNAALGVAQMAQLSGRVEKKRRLARRYFDGFSGFDGGTLFAEPEGAESNYWLNTLVLAPDIGETARDTLLDGLNAAGYMARPVWTLMHRLSFHTHAPRAPLPVAEDLERRIINLPSSAMLADRA
ncbi:aminotransferase DegT [Thioclava marina]|uniref:Aminotransferase DegT n=1 Tax=Thioclava marina TaxID=1915077 RepID=A0ABX3MKP8_9RHOB|nr:LegC family aminotransferase [Thioclava marina]OOY11992.1 aminotransferase DegT [Thioclava marina]